MRNIKAIPTVYDGINMRSRLEARWADLFTQTGWRSNYEPLDFDGGIPDFVVDHGYKPVLVDVKPYTSFGAVDELNAKIRHALGRDLDNTASLSPGPTQWTMVMMSARAPSTLMCSQQGRRNQMRTNSANVRRSGEKC